MIEQFEKESQECLHEVQVPVLRKKQGFDCSASQTLAFRFAFLGGSCFPALGLLRLAQGLDGALAAFADI